MYSHKKQSPAGLQYQQGELQGYLVREYLLEKWQRHCAYCNVTEIALQIEHIIPRSRGGSSRLSNLTLACEPCNVRKGTQTAEEFGYPEIQAQACVPLRDAAQVSAMKTSVLQRLQAYFGEEQVEVTYSFQTKYQRIQVLALPKSHAHDAVSIACAMGEVVKPLNRVYCLRCISRGQYQRFNGPHSAHKCWAPHKVRAFKLYERVRAKGTVGFIAGRREKGAFVIKDVASGKKLCEITPRKLGQVARSTQGWIVAQQPLLDRVGKEGGTSSPR